MLRSLHAQGENSRRSPGPRRAWRRIVSTCSRRRVPEARAWPLAPSRFKAHGSRVRLMENLYRRAEASSLEKSKPGPLPVWRRKAPDERRLCSIPPPRALSAGARWSVGAAVGAALARIAYSAWKSGGGGGRSASANPGQRWSLGAADARVQPLPAVPRWQSRAPHKTRPRTLVPGGSSGPAALPPFPFSFPPKDHIRAGEAAGCLQAGIA